MGTSSVKKIYFIFSVLFFLLVAFLPAIAFIEPSSEKPLSSKAPAPASTGESFRVLITETDKVVKLSRDDYIFGVVAAEIGATYHEEAIKAQAVAAYTFALFRSAENADEPYDITDDSKTDQGFITREQAKQKWGDKYDAYAKTIDSAVTAVAGYRLIDADAKPIMAAYHAVSAGRTESAEVKWGEDIPYLQPVESVGDLLAPDYLSVREFTAAELADKLSKEVKLEGSSDGWLGEVKWSESSTVTSATFGGKALSGERVRELLGLRSAAFEVTYSEESFTFKVKGYGHGVGMSQYGANYMAKCGSTFVEILSHYYTDCKMMRD